MDRRLRHQLRSYNETQIGGNYHDQIIAIPFPTWFFCMYTWQVKLVRFSLNIISLVWKRARNSCTLKLLLTFPPSFSLLFLKIPWLFSFHQILSKAEHSCSFPECGLGNVKELLLYSPSWSLPLSTPLAQKGTKINMNWLWVSKQLCQVSVKFLPVCGFTWCIHNWNTDHNTQTSY